MSNPARGLFRFLDRMGVIGVQENFTVLFFLERLKLFNGNS
jgi:hypothetical protein